MIQKDNKDKEFDEANKLLLTTKVECVREAVLNLIDKIIEQLIKDKHFKKIWLKQKTGAKEKNG